MYITFFLKIIFCVWKQFFVENWFNIISSHGATDRVEGRVAACEFGPLAYMFPHFVCLV